MQNHRMRTEAAGGGVTIVLDNNTTIAPKEDIFTLSKQLAKDRGGDHKITKNIFLPFWFFITWDP
jgi:hypothetical protein